MQNHNCFRIHWLMTANMHQVEIPWKLNIYIQA